MKQSDHGILICRISPRPEIPLAIEIKPTYREMPLIFYSCLSILLTVTSLRPGITSALYTIILVAPNTLYLLYVVEARYVLLNKRMNE